jgi:superfamily II DNA or RNA helicase
MIKIEAMNSVWCRTNEDGHAALHKELTYEHFYWIKNGFRPEKVIQLIRMMEHHDDGYYFLTGLLPRVLGFLEKKNTKYEMDYHLPEVVVSEPKIEGYKFRHYQERLVNAALDYGRGQLLSPTATGKSIIILGVVSAFPKENVLFLVHTKDLVKQMKADFVKAFPDEKIGEWSAKTKQIERITVATVQSYHKVCKENSKTFQVIIIDEAHHVSSTEGMYAQVLMYSAAHTKIGVTATRAANEKGKWSAEALLGPVLAEYTMKEASEDEVLAKPTIHIYHNPPIDSWIDLKEYEDKYSQGVIKNMSRNIKIVDIASEFIKEGKTTLVTVTSVAHGQSLERIFSKFDLDVSFIYGKSSTEERDEVKAGLKDGSILCAVASVIFLEGIDIPSLDVVINAGAGASPVQTMQRIGRALRKTETKDTAILVDFMDEFSGTLKRQSQKRIALYEQNDWPIKHIKQSQYFLD